jgi:capsular exopolysaccharide synthesis family protein
MDLEQYLHAVRTYWWAVVLPLVLALAVGAYAAARHDPQYRASVTFFVATSSEAAGSSAVQGDEFAQRRVNSYARLLTSDRLATKVIQAADLDLTPGEVTRMIGADSDVETVLLTATVTSGSRDLTRRVADGVTTEFVDLVDEVENPPGGPASVHLEVVSGPDLSLLRPRRALTVGLPAFLGLLTGLGLAWLLEARDKTIRSDGQLRALHATPVLGMIPFDRRLQGPPRVRHLIASSQGTESFRQLRTNLEFVDVDHPVQILVVTSSVAGEGKTTTTTNLALALVAAGQRVLVVEADLRRPTLDERVGFDGAVGLAGVIVGRNEIDAGLQKTEVDRLMVLPSGPRPPNPSELVGSDAMVRLLGTLRERFDRVIINTPPLLPVTDGAVLAAHADGVLMVVRAGKTTRHQLQLAMRSLEAVGARVLGTVLDFAPAHRGPSYAAYWHDETEPAEGSGPGHRLRRSASREVRHAARTVGAALRRLKNAEW